jgi:predicted nucleic acid-binding protein
VSPPPVILDASGPLALVLKQAEAPMMLAAEDRWTINGTQLIVPDHFWLEIANPLIRRHGWTSTALMAALREIDGLAPQTVAMDRPLLLLSVELAERHRLSAYDAAYAALAQITGATLATFDLALRAAFPSLLEPGFGPIPPLGVNEPNAPYGDDKPIGWADWSEIGSYLGVLRRRALDETERPARRR